MKILNRSLSGVVALCRISSSVVGLISGVPTSAAPRLVLQISDLHLRRYPILIMLILRDKNSVLILCII